MAGYASRNSAASSTRRERARRLIALAYILAVAAPPLGFGLGAVLALRVSSRHGAATVALSILASIVWIVIITSGALSTPNSGY